MTDIKPIKPISLCVNITIPTIDDDSISLYEAVGILGNKLQEAIRKINESLGSLEGAYSAENPPPYPVKSVNGKTGDVVITLPDNVYTTENPPPYPVKSVNRAETKDVMTVFEPEGGGIEDVSQAELIAACKAGARLGAFNQDDGTCRLYHFNLFINPERVEYSEIAGGGASGVVSVNNQTGAVNIFNAPISAATAASVAAIAQRIADYWQTIYPVGAVYISINAQSPAEIFGGTWEQIKGRFLLAAGDSYAAGSTGGYEYVKQASYLPPINNYASQGANNNYLKSVLPQMEQYLKPTSRNITKVANIANAAGQLGGDGELAYGTEVSYYAYESLNMPPYIVVYIWRRVS